MKSVKRTREDRKKAVLKHRSQGILISGAGTSNVTYAEMTSKLKTAIDPDNIEV